MNECTPLRGISLSLFHDTCRLSAKKWLLLYIFIIQCDLCTPVKSTSLEERWADSLEPPLHSPRVFKITEMTFVNSVPQLCKSQIKVQVKQESCFKEKFYLKGDAVAKQNPFRSPSIPKSERVNMRFSIEETQ